MTAGQPILVTVDVCVDLARGNPEAVAFFQSPPAPLRFSTVTYLQLLSLARDEGELKRIQRFMQPYPVLSLGPQASGAAVELITAHGLAEGLTPTDALVAATALAHEIPVVTGNAAPFENIAGLEVIAPY